MLWMTAPRRVMSHWDSAFNLLYGDHWFGPEFLSLIDPSTGRLINIVTVHPNQESPDEQGGFTIPFFTMNHPYYVPHPDKDGKGNHYCCALRTSLAKAPRDSLFFSITSPPELRRVRC